MSNTPEAPRDGASRRRLWGWARTNGGPWKWICTGANEATVRAKLQAREIAGSRETVILPAGEEPEPKPEPDEWSI